MLTAALSNAQAGTVTTLTLVMIAIGAVCAVAIIWWGTMRRRTKAQAIQRSREHEPAAKPVPREMAEPVTTPPVADPLPTTATAPIAAAAPESASSPGPGIAAEAVAEGRPLTLLKGLGPRAAARLGELGIGSVEELAALAPAQLEAIDAQMGALTGRIARDRWSEQAKLLAVGDVAGFEAAFGKLGG